MSVGMASTANNPLFPTTAHNPALPTTPIRSGEKLSSTAAALADKNAKTYYSKVPGSKFIMPDGLTIVFQGGEFTTADPAIIKELDAVANRVTGLIYTNIAVVAAAKAVAAKVALEASDTAGKLPG